MSSDGKLEQVQTLEWGVEIDGENKIIHYRAQCSCGSEHSGFMTERFAVRHATASA